jgi:hypothetical protein
MPKKLNEMMSLGLLTSIASRVTIMITVKNGAMTTVTAAMTIRLRAHGLGSFIATDQIM